MTRELQQHKWEAYFAEWQDAYRRRRQWDASAVGRNERRLYVPLPIFPRHYSKRERKRRSLWSLALLLISLMSIVSGAYALATVAVSSAYVASRLRDVRLARIEAQGVRRYKDEHGTPSASLLPLWRRILLSVEPPHPPECYCLECKTRNELGTIAFTLSARRERSKTSRSRLMPDSRQNVTD